MDMFAALLVSAGALPRSPISANRHAFPSRVGGAGATAGPLSALALDTQLARQGSNCGLPIALNLVKLMGGSIGIKSVGICEGSAAPRLMWACGRSVISSRSASWAELCVRGVGCQSLSASCSQKGGVGCVRIRIIPLPLNL